MEHYAPMECEAGEGKYRIIATALRCGADLCVTVCGGTLHHVGAVSLAQYEPERGSATVSTMTALNHRDDEIAAAFAKNLSRTLKCTVCVSVGIHVDAAGEAEIALLRRSCAECLEKLLEELK